jgi:hypothetical protein
MNLTNRPLNSTSRSLALARISLEVHTRMLEEAPAALSPEQASIAAMNMARLADLVEVLEKRQSRR